jgi:DNA-binding NtrC family response regulator
MTPESDDKATEPEHPIPPPEVTRAVQAPGTGVGIQIIVLSGSSKGTTQRIGERLRIGKAPDNDLVLADDTVSRHHCELTRASDGIHVRDLGSTNGTRVQGARVTEAVVQPGVVLKVGEVEMALRPSVRSVEVLPSDKTWFGAAIGQSLAMRTIFGILERIASTEATVLLDGETGTGKDVLARAIWSESPRAKGPFVVVDCGAVSYSLLESELFGHERGAFTGAIAARQGAFELADGGTIFLDEIGELPLDVQPKLLRVLETKEFRRVGGNRTLKTDVRVLVATKRNLQREVAAGKFREDLYFRLAVLVITLPALRERGDDVDLVAREFLRRYGLQHGKPGLGFAPDAVRALNLHAWPGNIRELQNRVQRAVIMAEGKRVTAGDLELADAVNAQPPQTLREARENAERELVHGALRRHGGKITSAALELGISRPTLYELMEKLGIGRD